MALVISGDSPSFSGTYQGGVITSGTAVASTSGTSIDFTSIPSWVKRITVMFSGVSLSSTANPLIQLGAGSVSTSGYQSVSQNIFAGTPQTSTSTAGLIINSNAAANLLYGSIVITLLSTNTWTEFGIVSTVSGGSSSITSGGVTLGGTLDRVRITTVNGTDTFDAGSINILYE
jgi:hypothetical protein